MSIIATLPINPNAVRVRYPVKRFSAPFVAGVYDFAQAGNTDVVLMKMQSNSVYCISLMSFFANVKESDWLGGMGTEAQFPFFRFRYAKSSGHSVFPEPVRCVNYIDAMEQVVFFFSGRDAEDLLITFGGVVNQVAGMVGMATLLAEVNFTIYQIVDQDWNKRFIQNPEMGIAPGRF